MRSIVRLFRRTWSTFAVTHSHNRVPSALNVATNSILGYPTSRWCARYKNVTYIEKKNDSVREKNSWIDQIMTSLTENGQCTEIINRLKIGESHEAIACWLQHPYGSFPQTAPWSTVSKPSHKPGATPPSAAASSNTPPPASTATNASTPPSSSPRSAFSA